jgi:type I restriction enzyme S subunit
MGRGRKPISNFNGSDWETVFYNSVGTYVQFINIELAKEYKLEPLSNHLKIVGGYAFKTAEYKSEGIPVIRISDFSNEQIVLKDVIYYQESKELEKYQLIEGDIIIALTGGTIAKLAIVQPDLGKIYLNQRVGKFQALNPDEFEVEYIYWLARSIQSIIKSLAWGAAIPNVSPKQIEELKFPFPKKEIQKGIIDFLNDLKNNNVNEDKIYFDEVVENEIISLQEKQITTSSISTELTHQLHLVKKLRQQLLQDAVQGKLVEQNKKDEPASELLKKIKAEKAKLIAEKKLKKEKELAPIKAEEIPFEIPENWVWCRLKDVCLKITDGTHFSPTNIETGKYKYITAKNIKDSGIDLTKISYVTEEVHQEIYSRCNPEYGDILYIKDGATTGIVTINDLTEEFSMLSSVALIKLPSTINNRFLMQLMRSPFYYNFTRDDMSGVAITRVTLEKIQKALIPLPPLSEQKRIVQKLDELMQYCNDLEASIKQSASQNEKLLQQVLREALRKEPVEV